MGSSKSGCHCLQQIGAISCALLLCALVIAFRGDAYGEDLKSPPGIFSSVATLVTKAYTDHVAVTVPSPDGQSRAVVHGEGQKYVLDVEGRIGSSRLNIGDGPNTEIAWAPDSEAFLLTENTGGLMGPYALTVVGRTNGHLVVRRLTDLVARKFGHPVRCFEPEDPNVVGVTWLGSSRELLAAAQIVSHSNCDSMGTFTAFSIDPWHMRVLKTYVQPEAKEHFSSAMGPRLLDAPECRDPKSCYIPQLHPELKTRH